MLLSSIFVTCTTFSLPFSLYSFSSRVLRTWVPLSGSEKGGRGKREEGNSCRIRTPSRQLLFRTMYFSLRFTSLRIEFPISVCATFTFNVFISVSHGMTRHCKRGYLWNKVRQSWKIETFVDIVRRIDPNFQINIIITLLRLMKYRTV